MLKMSFREKVVALVLIILVIVLIFVMGPIKMIRKNIETDEKKRETVQAEYDDVKRTVDSIPTLETSITNVYEASKDLSLPFSLHKENFQIDEYVQAILNNDNDYIKNGKNMVEIYNAFRQDDMLDEELEFYYYAPAVITYPILENADVNGDMLEKTDPVLYEKVQNAIVIEDLDDQKIEKHSSVFTGKFTKEGLFKFLDQLESDDTGVRLTELIIDNYKYGHVTAKELQNDPTLEDWVEYSSGTFTLEFYTMQQIQEPVFD